VSLWGDEEKRTVPKAVLKKMVYDRDKGICRFCGKRVHPFEAEIGHNKAYSRGGKLTFRNAILLHPACNRSMRTQTLKQARRSIGLEAPENKTKSALNALPISKLRFLAKKHGVRVKGTLEEGLFSSTRHPPSKAKLVNALAKVVRKERIASELTSMPVPKKRRKRRESSWW
jgi:hypothetical protein